MDGDGEYEIILKWAPSNEKDAASSGTTSPAFYSCYKLNGKRLWMLHTGPNMFNSAHTSQFIAWDFDGDGFGEFMVKTGPGAVDGEGNYLSLDSNPTGNYLGSNGKQVSGPEWISVFDGRNGRLFLITPTTMPVQTTGVTASRTALSATSQPSPGWTERTETPAPSSRVDIIMVRSSAPTTGTALT